MTNKPQEAIQIMKAYIFYIFLFLSVLTTVETQAQLSDFIHIDQFGYSPQAEKVAVISNPQIGYNANDNYTAGNTLELRDATTDNVVYSNNTQVWNNGAIHNFSGDSGWWFDFSAFNQVGEFYVFDPSTNHRSAVFAINANPFEEVLKASVKTFYYNRCNAPKSMPFAESNWTDVDNFPQDAAVRSANDQGNPATARDLTGGWFDAGDYNKYVTFAHNPIHQLLSSYEENPDIFTDDWNIPESNNGVPDILDELKWEFDWLYKMVNADGSVILKMGSLEYDVNDSAPPSNNTEPRYYTPTCSSASLSIASTHAHAAKVYAQIPSMQAFAQILESDAILCWNRFVTFYNNNTLETNCDDQTVKAGDADWDEQTQINNAIVAAAYLFDLTGEALYSDFVVDNIGLAEPIQSEFYAPHHIILLEAILNYATLANANPVTADFIRNSVLTSLNNNWGNYFSFSEDDLYRAYAPDYIFYWGSNMGMANIGNLCNTIAKYNVSPTLNNDLLRKAAEQLHYFHGVNPQGTVYLSNMYSYGAERSVDEIFHSWFNEGTDWDNALTSPFGPAPGFLAGGPNQAYTGTLTPPANQPLLKSFLDYNNGYSDVAYEITEPAIYYQAAYIQLLSNYVNTASIPMNGLELSAKVFLEGPYDEDETMNTNLTSVLPLTQPYNNSSLLYNGTENLNAIPANMVDWILVEARTGTPNLSGGAGTTVVETIAGILLDNGEIVGVSGAPIRFENLIEGDEYYFAIRHRNHLSVLTANPVTATTQMSYDFTTNINQAFGFAQQKISTDGKAMMLAGNANGDNVIQTTDYDAWSNNPAAVGVYSNIDFNLDGIIQATDYDQWFVNKAKLGIIEFL